MIPLINNLNLKLKVLPPVLLVTFIVLGLGGSLLINAAKNASQTQSDTAFSALKQEQESAQNGLLDGLKSKANIIGSFMAKTAPDLILSFDLSALESYQNDAALDKEVAYARYIKPEGSPYIDNNTESKDSMNLIEYKYPIKYDGESLGTIIIAMSKSNLDLSIQKSNSRIENAINEINTTSSSALSNYYSIILTIIFIVMMTIAAFLYYTFQQFILKPIDETEKLIKGLSEGHGDLTIRLPVTHKDEIGSLRHAVNEFMAELQTMIQKIAIEVETLNEQSSLLQNSSSVMSQSSTEQSHETSLVATAMNQMAATVQEVATNSEHTADAANEGKEHAELGQQVVNDTVSSIRQLSSEVDTASKAIIRLEHDSERIGTILDVINGIAEQTNLLALNAAIEAARAGEQGRGFAVVADEVRTLASRTHASTLEIRETIEHVQNSTKEMVDVMNSGKDSAEKTVVQAEKAGVALNTIISVVSKITDMTTQIAVSAKEQSSVAEEINRNISTINDTSEKVSECTDNTSFASSQLMQLSERLYMLTSQFTV